MLRFPGALTPADFLSKFWQKSPLVMPKAVTAVRPSLTRNELAWLATLDDVESRIVFTDRSAADVRYRVESGPFEPDFLQSLPKRDWSLLVHDVDKHLPVMRRLFQLVPFIPDWRIDDLMISFAAPGGSVGPHRDNYDVFLCQGIGARAWRYSRENIPADVGASDDLRLLQPFDGERQFTARQGDVLYLPPRVAHWGIAERACLTYSIGMRAPPKYADPDLQLNEVRPGYVSPAAIRRYGGDGRILGRKVTELKAWLQPTTPADNEILELVKSRAGTRKLRLHGMARVAFDDERLYLNGRQRKLAAADREPIAHLCTTRRMNKQIAAAMSRACLRWMLSGGAFEITETPDHM